MSLSITNTNKNSLTITNVGRDDDMTWDESYPLTWDDENGIWDAPRRPFVKDSKNSLSITNDNKI